MADKIKDVLSPIYNGAGAQSNFGGEFSYWFHKPLKKLGLLKTDGITFVSKTCTINARTGNTPFQYDEKAFNPVEFIPSSIIFNWFKKIVINKVGLGNPGLKALLETGNWQKRNDKYVISWMALGENQLEQAKEAARLFKLYKDELGDFIIEVNISCPNTEDNQSDLPKEALKIVEILSEVGVPIYVKVSIAAAPISLMKQLDENPNVTAIVCSNTVEYGWQPTDSFYGNMKINWKNIFGNESPLQTRCNDKKSGGLSGQAIKPFVLKFIKEMRKQGINKLIIGGGGIMNAEDVDLYKQAGADSVFIASAFMLRFYKIRSITKRAHEIFI